jgi:hypothetical protein
MARERDGPELEIELLPDRMVPPRAFDANSVPPDRGSPRARRHARWLVVSVVAIVTALVVTSLVIDDSEDAGDAAPATTEVLAVPSIAAPATTVPTTARTPTPNLLGAGPTGLSLWSFDASFRLQILDLDTGVLRSFGVTGDSDIDALGRETVVIWGFQDGTRVVDSTGATLRRFSGFPARPVAVVGTGMVWVMTSGPERRWQLHHPDGGLIAELPHDPLAQIVHYSDRAVLVVTPTGTSLFDIFTRESEFVTTTPVVAAHGPSMIGRRCSGDRCELSVIDIESRRERTLRADVPIDDVRDWALSPDGRHFAISRKSAGQGRFVEIIDVATALASWRSPDGISFAGLGPAWAWSLDSTRFFVTMSSERVIAVDARSHPFAQTDIALTLTPLHGLAVTNRWG